MTGVTRFQKFEFARVKRMEIKNAPYNPRILSREAKKRLQDVLQEEGLVAPLVWNKQTGLIVSGHQRLKIIDELEGVKDYQIDVAVIDVDEKTEKKLNIFMNNISSQGTWDEEKLLGMILDDMDLIANSGFNKSESDFFAKMLREAEASDRTKADEYLEGVQDEWDELTANVPDKELLETKKASKKEEWLEIVEDLFEPPPPKTAEEDVANPEFREARESKKRQEVETTCYLKIVFESQQKRASFLNRYGAQDCNMIHENDLL